MQGKPKGSLDIIGQETINSAGNQTKSAQWPEPHRAAIEAVAAAGKSRVPHSAAMVAAAAAVAGRPMHRLAGKSAAQRVGGVAPQVLAELCGPALNQVSKALLGTCFTLSRLG